MSGFTASNSRISITETVGSNEESAFDTENDMPHIVGTADQNFNVQFGHFPQAGAYWFTDSCSYYETETQCSWEYICNYEYVCETVYYYNCEYNCSYDYYYGDYECSYDCTFDSQYECSNELVCNNEYVCEDVEVCVSEDFDQIQYQSSNTENTQNICDLPTDEDGNIIDIDFVVIKATGSRTLAGTDLRISNNFLTTIPSKTFSFQGSMMLESSLQDNGDSWMKRIISVVIDNTAGKLKLRSKQTSDVRNTFQFWTSTQSTASNYSFNFKIFFGRFKS